MTYMLIFLCAVSIVVNILLVSYCTRTSHFDKFYKGETEYLRRQKELDDVKTYTPIEIIPVQDREGG